jgi:hypothetical protein
MGGHRAVGLMAAHANPIEVTNSIAFTVDTVTEAFELAAFALIGLGMLALAGAARAASRRWAGYTAAVALVLLVIAWSYGAGADGVTDTLLVAGGAVLLPLWLLWTSRISAAPEALEVPGAA